MRPKNLRIYNKDQETLVKLREEYIMLGYHTKLDTGVLTVLSLPPKKQKKKREDRPRRESRGEE